MELQNTGMIIEAIICDSAGPHKAFFRDEITLQGFTIPVFPDFVHFFKRLKTLADRCMKEPLKIGNGGCINLVPLKKRWLELQDEGGLLSPFPKLTKTVMNTSRFDSMRVKHALALLTSPDVEKCVRGDRSLSMDDKQTTLKFLKQCTFFWGLCNKYGSHLSANNFRDWKKDLQQINEYFQSNGFPKGIRDDSSSLTNGLINVLGGLFNKYYFGQEALWRKPMWLSTTRINQDRLEWIFRSCRLGRGSTDAIEPKLVI